MAHDSNRYRKVTRMSHEELEDDIDFKLSLLKELRCVSRCAVEVVNEQLAHSVIDTEGVYWMDITHDHVLTISEILAGDEDESGMETDVLGYVFIPLENLVEEKGRDLMMHGDQRVINYLCELVSTYDPLQQQYIMVVQLPEEYGMNMETGVDVHPQEWFQDESRTLEDIAQCASVFEKGNLVVYFASPGNVGGMDIE